MVDMDLFSTLRLPAHVSVPGRWRRAQPYTGVQIDHNELLLRSRKTETFASQMAPPCVRKLPRCISGREIFLLTPDARASRGPQQQQRFSHLRLSVELRLYLQSVPYLRYRTPPTTYCTGLPKLRKNKTQGTEGN
jgi:hypothetical protein